MMDDQKNLEDYGVESESIVNLDGKLRKESYDVDWELQRVLKPRRKKR